MVFFKLKCKMGICVADNCLKFGKNEYTLISSGRKAKVRVCNKHKPYFDEFLNKESEVNIIK